MKILLLEDDANLAKVMIECFEDFAETSWVENGYKGLVWLSEIDDFDIVITDYNMPEINGLEFIKALRRVSSSIPVVLFTGNTDIYFEKVKLKEEYDIQKIIGGKNVIELIEFIKKYKIGLTL
jgi:CheY-like chemotaxis protein